MEMLIYQSGFEAFGSRESFEGSASSLRLRELPCFTSLLVDLGFSRFDDDSSGREGNAGSAGRLGSNGIVVGVDADAEATGVLQPTSAADKWFRMASYCDSSGYHCTDAAWAEAPDLKNSVL